jgi:HK97 family phage major capsid protein
MQVDIPELGGYVAMPQAVLDEILEAARREFVVRRISRNVGRVARAGVGVRELTDRPAFQMGTELSVPNPSDLKFGKRTLAPKDYVGEVKVSRALLEEWTQGDSYIREQMAYGAGFLQESLFFAGNGSTEPLGLLTASDEGLPANRNLTSASAGRIGADDIIDMVLGSAAVPMRPAYYNDPSFAIIMSAHAFSESRKLKDGSGQYIFTPVPYIGNSLEGGVSYTILGKPVYVSEFLANVAANNTVAVAGAFRHYYIVDGLSTELQYLQELYARENKNGYIMRGSFDAAPFKNDSHTRLVVRA